MKKLIVWMCGICVLVMSQQVKWRYSYGNSYNGWGNCITHDTLGNWYLGGSETKSSGVYNFLIVSLDSSGNENWVYSDTTTSDQTANWCYSIIAGNDGNIYATGQKYNDQTGVYNFVVKALSSDDSLLWEYIDSSEKGRGLYIIQGTDGNLYIACDFYPASGAGVVSLTTDGQLRWKTPYQSGVYKANKIIEGLDGNLYVCGGTSTTGGSTKFFAFALDKNGSILWSWDLTPGSWTSGEAVDITQGADSNIYVSGWKQDTIILVSLDNQGNENWIFKYNTQLYSEERARSVIYYNGNIYLASKILSSGASRISLLCLSNSGNLKWIYKYTNYETQTPPFAIMDTANNIIYLCGIAGTYSGARFAVIAVDTIGMEIWNFRDQAVGAYQIAGVKRNGQEIVMVGTNYPNYCPYAVDIFVPVQVKENISLDYTLSGNRRSGMFDILGRKIKKEGIKRGIYFIKKRKNIRKILKIR